MGSAGRHRAASLTHTSGGYGEKLTIAQKSLSGDQPVLQNIPGQSRVFPWFLEDGA